MNKEDVILVFGSDQIGIRQEVKSRKNSDPDNWEVYDEERFQKDQKLFFNDLLESCMTKDLFIANKTILFKAEFLTEQRLKTFLETLPDSLECNLIISYNEIHPSRKKIFAKRAKLIEHKKMYEKEFKSWLKKEFLKYGKRIQEDALEYMTSVSNANKHECINEIQKLSLYCLDSDIIDINSVRKLMQVDSINEWVANDIVSLFFQNKKKNVLSLLEEASIQKKEIVVFEVLREAVRSLLWTFILFSEKERNEMIMISSRYHSAINNSKFWEISKITSSCKELCSFKIDSLPKNSPLKKIRQIMLFCIGLKWFSKKDIYNMLDILCDFEIVSKNRLGFSYEGMELLFFKIWELQKS